MQKQKNNVKLASLKEVSGTDSFFTGRIRAGKSR
jgi:hypothetical protein